MAKLAYDTPRKRRTRAHVIADLSVNHFEKQALLCGFTVQRIHMDYGVDLIVHTYNRSGEVENERIPVQIKASDRVERTRDGRSVACRIDKADLLYWLGESMPVILVQYDAAKDAACWVYVQEHMEGRHADLLSAGKQVTVAIPTANVLDPAAVKAIAARKNAIWRAQRRMARGAD